MRGGMHMLRLTKITNRKMQRQNLTRKAEYRDKILNVSRYVDAQTEIIKQIIST